MINLRQGLPVSAVQPFVVIKHAVVVVLPDLHFVQMEHRPENIPVYEITKYEICMSHYVL